ncbi:integrase [Ktedonobacter sp. SOSP1-85]|uniref:tyrosine-type recombinase/integrase n=1 Tax=Ktedonobacter sp. SOSP1-85 TaxID=2778367 RepID=UPI0019167A59|nr:tyrosine-type recombinase/integrase [Ktedonobacter sp. SOSP1-85]GHO79675.1 integrase [Ktedonobacter sp. SOSP1-85]
MKVQRIRLLETNQISWLVLDDDFVPIEPVFSYIKFLHDIDRSPNTIRNAAYHLKLFWEYLRDSSFVWQEVDIAQLAGFISWLRRQDPKVASIELHAPTRTNATIDQMLSSVHGFYNFHIRLGSLPELSLYRSSGSYQKRYKPFLHGIAKTKPEQTRVVSIKREQRRPKTLTHQQIQQILDACSHTRDKFLLSLLYETGMRVGQALGLRHADISVENGEVLVVPRNDNPNGARTKSRAVYTLPALTPLMQLYTDYLIDELGALEYDTLPDFVFVNLWEGEIGRPLTYAAVMSLVKRLRKKTGVDFTPHMFCHSRATTWIRDDKLPLPVVSRLLTHTSIQTTNDTYLHLTAEDLKKVLMEGKEVRDSRGNNYV